MVGPAPMGVLIALMALASLSPGGLSAQDFSVDSLDWLAGHWISADGAVEELWLAPRGNMLGLNRDTRDLQHPSFEYLRIETREGVPWYIARPEGQAETAFRLSDHGRQAVAFSDPMHDFPQHIRYHRSGDTLIATISGNSGGEFREVSWVFLRKRDGGSSR